MTREQYYKNELLKELKRGNLSTFVSEDKLNSLCERDIIDYGNLHFRNRDLAIEYHYKWEKRWM